MMRAPVVGRASALAVTLASLSQAGCILTMDSVSRLWPDNGPLKTAGTSLPVRTGVSTTEVKLDRDQGLVCAIVDTSMVRSTWIETEAANPNGVKTLVVLMTILEGSVFALAEWKGDYHFHSPYFIVPAGLDVGWGIFRSITIHPEIIRRTTVSVDGGEHAGSTTTASAPCPVGTEIALLGDGETLVAHVGFGGWLERAEAPALIAFLTAHRKVDLANAGLGASVKLDASAAADIVAQARRAADEAGSRAADDEAAPRAAAEQPAPPTTGGPPPPWPPPDRARAIIRLDARGRPQVYGVRIDFPPVAVCAGTIGCPVGQHCGDRGDGVPLCFGPGAIHRFCGAGTDCASAMCARRPDGVGVCQ
jgi:hypothetical protein